MNPVRRETNRAGGGAVRAFTLVELLVVILVLGLLIALLVPAASSAWDAAMLTKCKSNLNQLYKAAGLWCADQNSVTFPTGYAWAGDLVGYAENNLDVFRCPASLVPATAGDGSGGGGGSSGGGGGSSGGGGSGGGSGGSGDSGSTDPPQNSNVSIAFDVYNSRTVFDSSTFLWTVGIDSPWAKVYPQGNNTWLYQIEDQGWKNVADDYKDIDVSVSYKDGRPSQVNIIQGKAGSQGYRFDLKINGKLVVHNIDNYRGSIVKIVGSKDELGSGGSGGTDSGTPAGVPGPDGSFVYIMPFLGRGSAASDYGLSKGTHDVVGLHVPKVDAKLILLLDYAKSLANYTYDNDQDDWDLYFFTDPEDWIGRRYLPKSADWRNYFCLRHGGMANVLFCDGHIDTLGPADLVETSPLWRYSAAR